MVAMLIPALAPAFSPECVGLDAAVAVEEDVEVALVGTFVVVVLVENDAEVVIEVNAALLAELTCVVVEAVTEFVELVVELAELVVLVVGRSWVSHSGKMQNHSRSLTASTGTVWPTLAADIPTSLEPSP
jgi:hypothetical protein